MATEMNTLAAIFDGWNGRQTSLVNTLAPLTREQLLWRPAPHLSSAGELARHISLGRITWFERMGAPGSAELASRIGQISLLLGMQGIDAFELGDLFGHITLPPLADKL